MVVSSAVKRVSYYSLNAVNFFLAQIADVVVPFLNVYLRQNQWRYDQIGWVMGVTSFASLIFQVPAGAICDRIRYPRLMLAAAAVMLGGCYALLPSVVHQTYWIGGLLFITGLVGTFFAPLLGTLALALAGPDRLDVVIGKNRSWNHAGNMAAGLLAMMVVSSRGFEPLFYIAAILSMIAACCALYIRRKDLNLPGKAGRGTHPHISFMGHVVRLFREKDIRNWLLCLTFFFVANGPMGALVGLYLQNVGASPSQIAWMVLVAQPLTIPAAWWAGKYSSKWGRKPIFAIAFFLLPLRIFLYALASNPWIILAITALDGITAGIFGVLVFVVSSDLTRAKSGFNSLIGMTSTTPAIGATAGALLQGQMLERFGFTVTFWVFGAIALAAALLFAVKIRETSQDGR